MKNKNSVTIIAQSAVISALYAVVTYLSAVFGIAYGPVQFRFSEVLMFLSCFTPSAVPGLTIGCIIANFSSPMGIWDIIFGSLATLFSCVIMRKFRHIQIKGFPLLSAFVPAIFNGFIVGLEIVLLMPSKESGIVSFVVTCAEVACGELFVCLLLGIPFCLLMKKYFAKYMQ